MAHFEREITVFSGGIDYSRDRKALADNQLSDVQNFLPGPQGGIEQVKIWHKDLLAAAGVDAVYAGTNPIVANSADLETYDPQLPRFDNIDQVHYFITNNFDTVYESDPNGPIVVDGNNWTLAYQYIEPQGSKTIRAGIFLSTDVVVSDAKPLWVSMPVRQNGAYDVDEHTATATLYYVDDSAVAGLEVASATIDLKATGAHGRLEFSIEPSAATITLSAGEYYVSITQSAADPATVGYSFLIPPAYSEELFGWAEIPTAVTGEVVNASSTLRTNAAVAAAGVCTVTMTCVHAPATTPVIVGSKAYKSGYLEVVLSAVSNVTGGNTVVGVEIDINAQAWNIDFGTQYPAWNSVTAYSIGNKVKHGGAYYICKAASTNNAPPNATYWGIAPRVTAITWQADGLPVFTIVGCWSVYDSENATYVVATFINTSFSGVWRPAATYPFTLDYYYSQLSTLAELMVYQKAENGASYAAQAKSLIRSGRYSQKNSAMAASTTVRTTELMDFAAFTDGSSLWALYQTTTEDAADDGDTLFAAAMFNSMTQYTRWRDGAGTLSADRIEYYLPKFMGQINSVTTYQNALVAGGVGGLSVFNLRNLLEGANKGKINTPWEDIIVPDLKRRNTSQYLTDAGETAAASLVHPLVIKGVFTHGINPGRVWAYSSDMLFASGGATVGTVGLISSWQALMVFQYGDGQDEIVYAGPFGDKILVFTRKGHCYSLDGEAPLDAGVSFNTLATRMERRVGIVQDVVDSNVGWLFFTTKESENAPTLLWMMDGSLVPKPFDRHIRPKGHGRQAVDINIQDIVWDFSERRLYVNCDSYTERAYYVADVLTKVEKSARTYVWVYDKENPTWWVLVNPLDEDARASKSGVFRHGNTSWSVGYHLNAGTYTFYAECDIAGTDPLILRNDDESRLQPENSADHATESTAFVVTKEYTHGTSRQKQVRELQPFGRFIDGEECTVSVIDQGGTETSLGTLSGTTTFAALADKVFRRPATVSPRMDSYRVKLSVTSAYRNTLRGLTAKVNFTGVAK